MKDQTLPLTLLVTILFGISIYLNVDTSNVVNDLNHSHHELRWEVSDIRTKVDYAITQQEYIIEDIYASEIKDAKDIASSAGYMYEDLSFVSISGINMNVVRLRVDTYGSEIEVNIQTKVITTYSPQ